MPSPPGGQKLISVNITLRDWNKTGTNILYFNTYFKRISHTQKCLSPFFSKHQVLFQVPVVRVQQALSALHFPPVGKSPLSFYLIRKQPWAPSVKDNFILWKFEYDLVWILPYKRTKSIFQEDELILGPKKNLSLFQISSTK